MNRAFAALTLFMAAYLATFLFLGYLTGLIYISLFIAAALATAFANLVFDRGRWKIGLFVAPQRAFIDFVIGGLLASVAVLAADQLIGAERTMGKGFPWRELFIVFIPAVLHEELVFRGYLFQKCRAWNRGVAIALSSLVFAALHLANGGMTAVSSINLVIAGVLLAVAYEVHERLWLPIGFHLAWNVVSGPILGYGVSGYASASTVFVTPANGPVWLSGGAFGLEGSIWIGLVELATLSLLLWFAKRRPV